ncbi:hypothetical protein [Sulfolobus monocaudavirus SMV3]|uniref:hypothetical protein n=1 Tax=Sulfolobus monocaudavirus SMV3 TaxID=1732177 RepID=UPI000706401E|nr:hypothetical protein AXI69_gp12 [Sulfolobus monocaudavirus SMV3]ALG96949.1 hypothetical protein [Sulfolobus monocaudavirus SMV3]
MRGNWSRRTGFHCCFNFALLKPGEGEEKEAKVRNAIYGKKYEVRKKDYVNSNWL